jgi:hypothetical protein
MTIPALDQNSARARTPERAPNPATSSEGDPLGLDAENAEEKPPVKLIQADCAFIVYRQLDGRVIVTADLSAPIAPARQPTTHDVVGMCANAQDDVRAQATIPGIAQAVVGKMMEMQQAMQNQMENMAVRQQMANGGRP